MKSRKWTNLFCSLLCASLLLTLASPAAFAQEPAETVLPTAGASPQLAGCPSSIGFGETIQCSLDSSGEIDTFTFTANAGDKVLVRMTGLSGIVWPKISVNGPDETSLCETWAFSTAEIASCSLGATGDYAILSSNDWVGETGAYSLYVQRLNNPGSSVSIAFGQTPSASLDSVAEIDTYTFAANAGDKVLLRMTELPGLLLSPEFRVYGPDGAQLCATSYPYPATVSCNLTGTGNYAILADSSFEDETGAYYLYLQRLNNPGNSAPITFGQILSGSIDSLAEMDAYTFAASAGDKVLVRMGGLSDFPLHIWPEIEVYGPDGTQVCGASRGNDVAETPTCSLTGTGTYTILALDHPGTGTSAYALYLQRLNHPAYTAPIAFGQTRSGTIVSFADMHTYTFAANAGDRVLVRMRWISGVFEPEVRVNGPDGTQLCKALGVYAAEIASCTLPATGNYAILAGDAYDVYTSGIFTGLYTLYLQRLSQSTLPSIPAQDGWVLESGENTNLGGVPNSTATTFRLGDDASRKQYRTVLSFNTGALPDNAVITGVTLKLRRQSIAGGGNPFTTFQGLFIDVRKGFFGTSSVLQAADFQAAASKSVGPFNPAPVGTLYTISLPSTAYPFINKAAANGGLTQLRLRFKLDDNNNTIPNFISFYSGNYATAALRPALTITYYIP